MKKIRNLALIAVLALALCACGKKEATPAPTGQAAPTAAAVSGPLTLTDWNLSASTWSSPNGATIHITATPSRQGQSAGFIVRLEGDEVANIPCQWTGSQYTASADLNGANGYCYYLALTDTDGTTTEYPVNTPTAPRNESYINLEDALNSYCTVLVEDSTITEKQLILNSGTIQVQAPKLGDEGQVISCVDVMLILSLNGEELSRKPMIMQGTGDIGFYSLEMSDVAFDLPTLEGEQQISLDLEVKLSNGQVLFAPGGVWYTSDEGLMAAVG